MRRILSTLLATFVVIFGVLSFTQTAHAAEGTLTLTPSATTINPGESVTLTWESTGVINLEAEGDWPVEGPVDPSGSITVQLDYPGEYYFDLYGNHEDEPDVEIEALTDITVTGDLVSVTTQCGAFTVTNLWDIEVEGAYGDYEEEDADEYYTLGPNATRTFTTDRTEVDFQAYNEFDADQEIENLAIPQDCDDTGGDDVSDDTDADDDQAGSASGHPTVAPAAGIADNAGASPLAAVSIALLIGAAIAARRLHADN